jgi:TetR/AcrR family transcriptional regulator, transcriptional repressor for nem operon
MQMVRRPTPPRRPRAETKQATHAALIAAGIEEFSEHGLDASLDAICARAKLTRGAFYVHFADRDSFIVAVMNHVLGGFITELTGRDAELGSVERSVRLFFAAAQARDPVVHAGRGLRFSHLMDACRRIPQVGETYRRLITVGRAQLASGLATDQTAARARTDLAPDAIADLMTVMALGIVAALELEIPLDVPRLGDTALAVIGATPPARRASAAARPRS